MLSSRSASALAQRALAPNVLRLARLKSTATKSLLFSPMPRRVEVAVTPKRVTLKFGEDLSAPVAPKPSKAVPSTKALEASIEAKIKKGIDAAGTKVTKARIVKVAGPVKKVKPAPTAPKATKSSRKESSGSAKSTEAAPCWVDASPTHIAILIGDQYKVFALNNGWMTKSRDINWAETAAFELLAQILAQQGRTGAVQVNSDSSTALSALSGQRIRVPEIMESVRRTSDILEASMFTIKGVKVSHSTNRADKFTRGKVPEGYEKLKDDITVPKALVPFVTAV